MKRGLFTLFLVLTFPLFFLGFRSSKTHSSALGPQIRFESGYGKLPLAFEPNQGQTDPQVQFLSRGEGYTLFLTDSGAVFSFSKPLIKPPSPLKDEGVFKLRHPRSPEPSDVLSLKLMGLSGPASFEGGEKLSGISNYFLGKDPAHWHTRIPQYAKVEARGLYPGVDMVYYGIRGAMEYDFKVQPGADPKLIRLKVEGVDKISVGSDGSLNLAIGKRKLVFRAPILYQGNEGVRTPVEGRYLQTGEKEIGFEVKAYDRTKPLVIDPVLDYSTYLGGTGGSDGFGVAVDSSGCAYITGAAGINFPVTSGAYQTDLGGTLAYITKLDASGNNLLYSTYLGGNGGDIGYSIAVDLSGCAYVTGDTYSSNFPTTSGAFQTVYAGGSNFTDAFMAKMDASGSTVLYSTYLGGGSNDIGYGIALDPSENAYVTGYTQSSDFPITGGAYQTTYSGGAGYNAFVAKLNPAGGGTSDLVYSTYLGGNSFTIGAGIAVDLSGCAYVTGTTSSGFDITGGAFQIAYGGGTNDAFVTKLNASGSALLYSTYLGGGDYNNGCSIAVDSTGCAYVRGYTSASDFPTTPGAYQTVYGGNGDAFISKMNASGSALLYSTYLGGSGFDGGGWGIAIDLSGNAYVTGYTESTDFPTTSGAYQTASGGVGDTFVSELNASGNNLLYSTYLGGNSSDYGYSIAVDSPGNVYVTGYTDSTNFPTTGGAYQTGYDGSGGNSAFVAKFDASMFENITNTPTLTPTATLSFTTSLTPTLTTTYSPSPTPTVTPSLTPTATLTLSSTASPTASPTLTPSSTETATPTPKGYHLPTDTPTPVPIGIGPPYPNPDKGQGPVNIPIQAAPGCSVRCRVYTTAFRKIRDFSDPMAGAAFLLTWDMDDNWQSPVANGLYYVKVEVTGPVQMSKLFKVLVAR